MNARAERRREARAHDKRAMIQGRRRRALSNLRARHGRASFIYDFASAEVVTELDELEGPETPFIEVWPEGRPGSDVIAVMLGCVQPEGVIEWCDSFEPPVPVRSTRMLVSCGCEHIRDDIAAHSGWGDDPYLQSLFAADPSGWIVWALVLIDEADHDAWQAAASDGGVL